MEDLPHGEPNEEVLDNTLAVLESESALEEEEIEGEGFLILFEPYEYSIEGEESVR